MTKHLPEEERRRQILDAARVCFVKSGYSPTKMDDIATEAGLSKGGLYFHYKSKRDLFIALLLREYEISMGMFAAIKGGPQSPSEKIDMLANFFLPFFANQPEVPRFFMVTGEMALRDDTVRELLGDLHRKYVGTVAELLKEGVEGGQFAEIDVTFVAEAITNMLNGTQGRLNLGDEPDISRMARAAIEMIMNGIRKRP